MPRSRRAMQISSISPRTIGEVFGQIRGEASRDGVFSLPTVDIRSKPKFCCWCRRTFTFAAYTFAGLMISNIFPSLQNFGIALPPPWLEGSTGHAGQCHFDSIFTRFMLMRYYFRSEQLPAASLIDDARRLRRGPTLCTHTRLQ